jgi:phosphate-selective porin OprO and OprP
VSWVRAATCLTLLVAWLDPDVAWAKKPKPPPEAQPAADAPADAAPDAAPPATEAAPAKAEPDEEKAGKSEKASRPGNVTFKPGHGVTLESEDGNFALRVRARIQVRGTVSRYFEEELIRSIFEARRVRLSLSGHAYSPDFQYKVQLGFGSTETEQQQPNPLLDAWIRFAQLRDLNVTIGQKVVNFDLARIISSSEYQFVDRALVVNELSLARDVGVELSSEKLFGVDGLSYSVGVFSGEGLRPRTTAPFGVLYAGRIQIAPLGGFDNDVEGDLKQRHKPKLSFGVAAAYNRRSTAERSTGGTGYQRSFDYQHGAVDASFKWYGVSLLGEALFRHATQRTHGLDDPEGTIEASRNAWGWLAQAGVMITSQFEIAGRYAQQYAMHKSPQELDRREIGGAASYYFYGHPFKAQADYARVLESADFHQVRLQVQLSL